MQFVDRLKDLIISGGINISPVELEQAIAIPRGCGEVAVIAATDERFGETPPRSSLLRPLPTLTRPVVWHWNGSSPDYKVPRYVVLRSNHCPRLPSGKLAKLAIRAQYHDIAERFARAR